MDVTLAGLLASVETYTKDSRLVRSLSRLELNVVTWGRVVAQANHPCEAVETVANASIQSRKQSLTADIEMGRHITSSHNPIVLYVRRRDMSSHFDICG
jgi:hypothetical protein